MSKIAVYGAGAFGTALAIALAKRGGDICLWGRNPEQVAALKKTRINADALPDATLPDNITVTDKIADTQQCDIALLAVPMQALDTFMAENGAGLGSKLLVACCKGIDLKTLKGPTHIIKNHRADCDAFVLSGPSFARDIAVGLPTALTLAGTEDQGLNALREELSTDNLRLYSSHDPLGVELGGALKNVIAIASGIAVGAGLGDSARAAVMTRGFKEMLTVGRLLGAQDETFYGLSGFGDLTLTCSSMQSRNYRYGIQRGKREDIDEGTTVEGVATAKAMQSVAAQHGIDLPIISAVGDIVMNNITVNESIERLMARPLKEE